MVSTLLVQFGYNSGILLVHRGYASRAQWVHCLCVVYLWHIASTRLVHYILGDTYWYSTIPL